MIHGSTSKINANSVQDKARKLFVGLQKSLESATDVSSLKYKSRGSVLTGSSLEKAGVAECLMQVMQVYMALPV